MGKCKLCGEDINDEITFKNLFRINIDFHDKCERSVKRNPDVEIIPSEYGYISYLSAYLNQKVSDNNYFEVLSYKFFENILEKSDDYDIFILIEDEEILNLDSSEMLLISSLSMRKIIFLSVLYIDFLKYENIFH